MSENTFNSPISRRTLFAIGGGLAATAALAACGSDAKTTTPSSAGGTTASGATTAGGTAASGSGTTTAGAGGAKATIQQWYHQYGEAGTEDAVNKYAASYANAKVVVSWKPGDYDTATAASLLTDAGPDVFEYGNGPTIDMIKANEVVDMTDAIGSAASDFNASVLKRMTYDGKIWAIPQVIDMQLLVYRKSMLEKAGVKPPETIDELIAAAKALTSGNVKGLFLGNDGGAGLVGAPMLWSVGLDYLTEDNKFGFDDDKAATAFAKLHTLFTSNTLLLGQPKDWYAADAIVSGQCAMQFTGLWTFPDLTKGLADDYGAIPWPASDGGKKSVPVGAYGACVSAKSKNVEAAKAFAKYLWVDQTDDQIDFATSYGFHIPSRTSLIPKAKTLASGPAADAAKYAVDFGHAQNQMLWTPKCGTAFGDMMSRIVKDGADPKSEIATCKAVVDAELKRVG